MPGTLLVTGGSRGIGAAVARMGAREGYAVAVNYARHGEAADGVVQEIRAAGGRAEAFAGDVSREAEVSALFDAVIAKLGGVTALAHCAGITGPAGRVEDVSADTLQRVVDVNVMGCMLCCREAARRMSRRHGGAGGAIVTVSTAAATLGAANQYVWYAASKAAVDCFTLGFAREVMADGIRANTVSPGIVDTDIHLASGLATPLREAAAQTPAGRMASPEEIAASILWLLSDAASYCVGSNLRVAGGR